MEMSQEAATTTIITATVSRFKGIKMTLIKSLHLATMLCLIIICKINAVQSDSHYKESSDADNFAPRLVGQVHNVIVKVQKPYTIECPIEAQPAAQMQWFKNGEEISTQHVSIVGNEIMFLQVRNSDTGDYHCVATNKLGSVQSAKFSLLVQNEPYDKLVAQFQRPHVHVGELIEVGCSVLDSNDLVELATKSAHLQWKQNGKLIDLSEAYEAEISDLRTSSTVHQFYQHSSRFLVGQTSETEFVLAIKGAQLSDNNSKFTCQLVHDNGENGATATTTGDNDEQIKESAPITLIVVANNNGAFDPNELNMGAPIEGLDYKTPPQVHPPQPSPTSKTSSVLSFSKPEVNSMPPQTTALLESVRQWLQNAHVTQVAVVIIVIVVILLQFVFAARRRKSRHNRYMKHEQQYNSSAGSSSLQAEQAIVDPFISSLMSRSFSTSGGVTNITSAAVGTGVAPSSHLNPLLGVGGYSIKVDQMLSGLLPRSMSVHRSNSNHSTNSNDNNNDGDTVTFAQLPPPLITTTSANNINQSSRRASAGYKSYRDRLCKVAAAEANDGGGSYSGDDPTISPYAISSIYGKLQQPQQFQQHLLLHRQQPPPSMRPTNNHAHSNSNSHCNYNPNPNPNQNQNHSHNQNNHSRSQSQSSQHHQKSGSKQAPQPPPMSAEAMRTLNEQFDINQLVLIEEQPDVGSCQMPQTFEAPEAVQP